MLKAKVTHRIIFGLGFAFCTLLLVKDSMDICFMDGGRAGWPASDAPPLPTIMPAVIEEPRTPKLADGCYHVFLDVGANIGVHGRFLSEPEKYPDASVAYAIFNREFGPDRDNRDFCIFEFEPNPSHHGRITKTAEAYVAMGWRYTLVPVGVSDEDSTIQFYHRGDEAREEWGFNAIQSKSKGKDAKAVDIPVVRLAQWLEDHVYERIIPSTTHGTYESIRDKEGVVGAPKVVMKMDIEGMEFRVLPDLIISGIFCRVFDFVFGEMHGNKKWYPMTLPNEITLQDGVEGLAYIRSFTRAMVANPTCKTVYVEDDEEAYLHDGIPLPQPSRKTAKKGVSDLTVNSSKSATALRRR
jgi:hypothetical protein